MGRPLAVTIRTGGTHLELQVDGELDRASGPELLRAIEQALEGDPPGLDLDLSRIGFMDSGGIDALVAAQQLSRQHLSADGCGRVLRIVRPSRPAQIALLASGVDGYLEIVDDPTRSPEPAWA